MGSFYAQPKIADTMQVQADMEQEYGVTISFRVERYGLNRNIYISLHAYDTDEQRDMGLLVRESLSYQAFDKKLAAVMLGMLTRLEMEWGTPSWSSPKRGRAKAVVRDDQAPRGTLPDSLPDVRRKPPL